MKTEKNFSANVRALAAAAHQKIMNNGMAGIYEPLFICGVKITCADDAQSVHNRLCTELRKINFSDIDKELELFGLPV